MKLYIINFLKDFEYPKEASEEIIKLYEKVKDNTDFNKIILDYYNDEDINIDKPEGPLGKVCEEENINFYSAKLLTYICLTKQLKKEYERAGICEQIYRDTVEDLIYKMRECYEVHKVWGIFSPGWYNPVFHMKTFVLGRLAYNIGEYNDVEVTVAGRIIKKGCKTINIHIPSSGKPFNREARLNSYAKAYEFFKDEFSGEYPVFKCDTWLLYEKHKQILGEKSNISSFIDDFKIVISCESKDDSSFKWRIFGDKANLPHELLPEDTSMRRAFKEWLKKGNKLGGGMGVFIYDPIRQETLTD